MTHLVNIIEYEKEVEYLRDQTRKLIKELSQTARENAFLREQLLLERSRYRKVLDEAGIGKRTAGGSEDDDFCLN